MYYVLCIVNEIHKYMQIVLYIHITQTYKNKIKHFYHNIL